MGSFLTLVALPRDPELTAPGRLPILIRPELFFGVDPGHSDAAITDNSSLGASTSKYPCYENFP
jgi:hypothetical protein